MDVGATWAGPRLPVEPGAVEQEAEVPGAVGGEQQTKEAAGVARRTREEE
jgi:hypothetical protein